jgi:hypothetical protein
MYLRDHCGVACDVYITIHGKGDTIFIPATRCVEQNHALPTVLTG